MELLEIIKQLDGSIALAVMIWMWADLKKKHKECESDRKELWQKLAKITLPVLALLIVLTLTSCGFHVGGSATVLDSNGSAVTIDFSNASK